MNYFALLHNCRATQQDCKPDELLSTSHYAAATFTSTECGRMVKQPVGRPKRCLMLPWYSHWSLGLPHMQVAPLLALHNVSNRASVINEHAADFG